MISSFVERKTWAFRWIESKFIWLSILWKKIIFSWLVLFPLEGAKYLLHRVIINLYLHDINIYLVVTFPQSYLEYYKILQLEFRISQKVCHYFFEWFALINGVTAGQTLEREWVWIMLCLRDVLPGPSYCCWPAWACWRCRAAWWTRTACRGRLSPPWSSSLSWRSCHVSREAASTHGGS